MRAIPDFDIELAQSIDFILNSKLAKRALENPPYKNYVNILIEMVKHVDRLADNCHMPEFTNHAMPHICSIVKRASEWAETDDWLKRISPQEAGYLLMALIIHDIGMLSQDARDIPDDKRAQYMKGLSDTSNWVRRTHVIRIDGLVNFLLKEYLDLVDGAELLQHLNVIIAMAQSHSKWPWEADFVSNKDDLAKVGLKEERIEALNSVIAVCDLLDEDSNRCDTITLIKHRHGTIENMAHWIRHSMTKEVIGVREQKVIVHFRTIVPKCEHLEMVFRTLRNHYKLVKLYNLSLKEIQAEIKQLVFNPSDGISQEEDEISKALGIYQDIPEFKYDLVPQLMKTFMAEAKNLDGEDTELRKRLNSIGLETIDMSAIADFMYPGTQLYQEERVIFGQASLKDKLEYLHILADKAYSDGKIGELQLLCVEALNIIGNDKIYLNQIYWAMVYLVVYEKSDTDYRIAGEKYPNSFNVFEDKKNIIPQAPYKELLDVLFCFLAPNISDERLQQYKNLILNADFSALKDDLSTALLIRTVIGMFAFWSDKDSTIWNDVAFALENVIGSSNIVRGIKEQREQFELQYKILYNVDSVKETDCESVHRTEMAKAWTHFYQSDCKKMLDDIPRMVQAAEYNTELFSAVQGYQNMTKTFLERNCYKVKGKIADSHYAGIYRYQRILGEQALPMFWEHRKYIIEAKLSKSNTNPNSTGRERIEAIRLISLRYIEALVNWNLGEYIESLCNYSKWLYESTTYEDKYGKHRGYKSWLPKTIIIAIQAINAKIFSDEQIGNLFVKIRNYCMGGVTDILNYIIENPCKVQWEYAIKWLPWLVQDMNQYDITRLLDWLLKYEEYVGGIFHFNLKEYAFLKPIVNRFTDEDWMKAMLLLEKCFESIHIYKANEDLGQECLTYMPEDMCKKILEKMLDWPEDKTTQKRSVLNELFLNLAVKRKELKGFLHQLVARCMQKNPCRTYQELDELIDVQNLSERDSIEWDDIIGTVDVFLNRLKEKEQFFGYNSTDFDDINERFTNQNWRLAEEEQVILLIQRLEDFMVASQEKLSVHYFYGFCCLLNSINRMGTEAEKKAIVKFFIEKFIINYKLDNNEKNIIVDGPLQTAHIDFGEHSLYEQGILAILTNGITAIPKEYRHTCLTWTLECLSRLKDKQLYYYAVTMFTYYYFNGGNSLTGEAWSGLMYIRGLLEINGINTEMNLKEIIQALKNLNHANEWFNGKSFADLLSQDSTYKDNFFDSVHNMAQVSSDQEIYAWSKLE